MSVDIKLEVCVDSIASAIAAAEGGATRIELCSALSEGGLTPTAGILKTLKELPLAIPIFCMLRPRRGDDFVYSDFEMNAIIADMDTLHSNGADGFVFGALTEKRTIDVEKCQKIVLNARGLPVTFHRAYDLTNPLEMHDNVECLREIGFKRILSSGFRRTALDGSEFLAQLIAKHHRDIIIMPGAGITVLNVDEIITTTKCIEFHASALSVAGNAESNTKMDCDVTMGRQDVEPYIIADTEVVRKMVAIARAMATIFRTG